MFPLRRGFGCPAGSAYLGTVPIGVERLSTPAASRTSPRTYRGCYQRVAICTNGDRVLPLFFGVIADWTHGRPSTRSMIRNAVMSFWNL